MFGLSLASFKHLAFALVLLMFPIAAYLHLREKISVTEKHALTFVSHCCKGFNTDT